MEGGKVAGERTGATNLAALLVYLFCFALLSLTSYFLLTPLLLLKLHYL